jgi:hypothetical protein
VAVSAGKALAIEPIESRTWCNSEEQSLPKMRRCP